MTKLRTAQAALDDLEGIAAFGSSTFGSQIAEHYLIGLREVFDWLEKYPMAGSVREELAPAIRSFGYRSHRIYYRYAGDDLLVVRVLHRAQDAAHALESEQ